MNMQKPLAVVLLLDETDKRQPNQEADRLRADFAELIKLSPSERKVRIDEILRVKKERA